MAQANVAPGSFATMRLGSLDAAFARRRGGTLTKNSGEILTRGLSAPAAEGPEVYCLAMSRRIAIVEDEPAIRANYTDSLKKQGYDVSAYATRRDALAALRVRLPDLALIDIGLADDIDGGFALCRELRALSATLPIIFLSARDSDFDIVAGLRLGADDYLTKDVSLPHLSARIAALFRRSDLLAAPHAIEDVIERGKLTLDFKRLSACLGRQARRLDADRILDGAHAGAASRSRQGSRQPDARRQDRRRRQHHHLARQAHPAEIRGARSQTSTASHGLRHGVSLER